MPGLIVVAAGSLSAKAENARGDTRRISKLQPGDAFGQARLFGPAAAGASLQALEASRVFVIPAGALTGLLARDPLFAERVKASVEEPPEQAPLPELLGGLVVRRLIAEGGMGSVYEAFDPVLKRVVAVKRLRPELRQEPKAAARLLEEARIVAALRHPNIVEIFSVVDKGGEMLLVFEFVDGRTLDQLLFERGSLPLPECLRIVRVVVSAVDFAHSRRVLHRDLKPGNIMLRSDGVVKVMDFGIARQAKDTLSRITRTDPFGTFAYMAPEHHLGEAKRQGDIFSLAVTLYQMLTGEMPFPGPDYLTQKEARAFVPVSQRKPGLPPQLDAFFARALAPDLAERYGTVGELMADLEAAAR